MRKTAEQVELELVDKGVLTKNDLQDARFVKLAMIERVMHNIQTGHERAHGSKLWDEQGYENTISKVAAAVSVKDIMEAADMESKVGLILKEIKQ